MAIGAVGTLVALLLDEWRCLPGGEEWKGGADGMGYSEEIILHDH